VRKYVRQDYERMESLNQGSWCFVGIRAEAEIVISADRNAKNYSGTIQQITSGGLWGVESTSEASYLRQVAKEELTDLRAQLIALGFTSRAVSQAFKSVSEVNS
jgi:hypothetical protein